MESNDLLSTLTQSLKTMNNSLNSLSSLNSLNSSSSSNVDLTDVEEEVPLTREPVSLDFLDFGETRKENEIHGEFKSHVKELAEIEDMIKKYNDLIKKLKDKKDELKTSTIDHMVKYEIDVAKMNENDKFSLVTVKRIVNPAAKSRLQEKLKDYFITEEAMKDTKADEKSKKIFGWLYTTADTKTDQLLRRYRK